jgi:mRNA-degrading endonuclease HigB of HigAB toxin-antitoxin module|nr:MAG TPA: TIR domain [Caudoviricetes sp.]
MAKVFLSHSSSDKEYYVRVVYNRIVKVLGEENVILDEITFQEGRRTIEEIQEKLGQTDLFVFFISDTSLNSDWVKKELIRAKELWSDNQLRQICPIIIDSKISYDDYRIPEWMQKEYNIQYINRQSKISSIILQRMVEISYEKHPKLKERNNLFVGRTEYLKNFEERMDDFDRVKPITIIASGIKSIGRRTLIKKCLFKSNIVKDTYTFPIITLKAEESIEDFIFKLYDLGFNEERELTNFINVSMSDKVNILIEMIIEIQKHKEMIIIDDEGCIVNHDGDIASWYYDINSSTLLNSKVTFCIISKFRYIRKIYGEIGDKIYSIEVEELNKNERNGLLTRYLNFEEIELDVDDLRLISNLLSGFPEQVFYTTSLIKRSGIEYLRANTNLIVDFNTQKANVLISDIEHDKDKIDFLSLLASFDCISTRFIFEIVGNEEKYQLYLQEFISKAICEHVGVLREYIRVNEIIRDYINRSNYKISSLHKEKLEQNLSQFLNEIENNEYDIPEFLYSLKEAIVQNKFVDEKYIIPSLYLKTMNQLYNTGKNKEVISFADKALEKEEFMDPRIVFELRYLLCLALAKLKNDRFKSEVMKIQGADHEFLFGFYYRQISRFDKALEKLNLSLSMRKNFSKAKREKVQVYLGMQEYQAATELAKENYSNYKENAYHIQAYFTCLIKAEKSKENREVLLSLLEALNAINSEVAQEMYLRCNAQFTAIYNEDYYKALELIDKAIEMNPNIQYARIVKFDISDKFNQLDDMKKILEFLKQPEYKIKYASNIICFTAIIMAKEGNLTSAVEYFKANIRNYTDEAIDRFIIRLNRYA